MKSFTKKSLAIALSASLLSGCGVIKWGSKDKTPVLGDRQPVLGTELEIGIDAATAALPMALPGETANKSWEQSSGNASHSMGQLALPQSIGRAWSVSIGDGADKSSRLGSSPVVADGRIFTIDTKARVRAFSTQTGGNIWTTQFGAGEGNESSLYGGGVSYGSGRVYATNGLGDVVALNPENGSILWQVKPAGPMRGAPTVAGDVIYVTTQDNQLFQLNAADGKTNWSNAAALEIAGVFGTSAPAAARGTVIAGFSSGELNAYRYENGRAVWGDSLTRTSISTSVSSLSDIDADPVIDNGQVIAIGQGGRMVALDLLSGQRMWEINVSGISTPWVAGEWAFVVNNQAQVMAISRATGRVRWINQLPAYRNEKKKKDPINYVGPVLAGGRLIVAGNNGALININPDDGAFMSQTDTNASVSLQPVVADNMLFLLADNGTLIAYR